MKLSCLRRWAPVLLALFALTCGGNGSPTGVTPSPTPGPTPTPQATPTPPPASSLCTRLGYVPSPDTRCTRDENKTKFKADLDAAIDKVIAEHGKYFENGSGGVRVKNFGAFVVSLIDNLDEAGVCAGFDGEEIQVKNSNDFNEQYDVTANAGWIRRADSAYRTTCAPAAFPTPPPAPISPPAGCPLPSSREIACGPAEPSYLDDIKASIDQAVQEHPEIFDLRAAKGEPDAYYVKDITAYHQYVVANMVQRGYCARFDGEEVVIKKTNVYTDHYDVLTGDNYIRRGQGEYRVSCYPAAF